MEGERKREDRAEQDSQKKGFCQLFENDRLREVQCMEGEDIPTNSNREDELTMSMIEHEIETPTDGSEKTAYEAGIVRVGANRAVAV